MKFEATRRIAAPADNVFHFVADVNNLPRYLPTTQHAVMHGGEKVHIEGEAHGQPYDADGFLKRDSSERRMEWGAQMSFGYRGWLQVKPVGNDQSEVTVHLEFHPDPQSEVASHTSGPAPDGQEIQQGMERALKAIQNHLEGNR